MNQHTKTPWIVGKQQLDGTISTIFELKQSGRYQSLAQCDIGDDPTDEANAAFIVRAVNNHDALVLALKNILAVEELTYDNQLIKEARAILKEAQS